MNFFKFSSTTKIGIGWALAISAGLYSFYISKQYIDKNRYESMKARERIRKSNQEEYEQTRIHNFPKIVVPKS